MYVKTASDMLQFDLTFLTFQATIERSAKRLYAPPLLQVLVVPVLNHVVALMLE